MPELLDLPISLGDLARISVPSFHRLAQVGIVKKRAELIRGIILEKPAVTPLHRRLGLWLYDRLKPLAGPDHQVFHESPLTLRDSEPMPDVMVAAGRASDFREAHPSTAELLIEVAVSSEALDRGMAALYAEAGVKEYWIVLASRSQVEVYREASGSDYRERRLYGGNDEIVCA